MKKILATILVGTMLLSSMTVFAAPSVTAKDVAPTVAAAPVAPAVAAAEAGAAAAQMSVVEYTNNAIAEVPGIPASQAEPVANGQGAIIDGVKTNYTVALTKVNASVASDCAVEGGKLISVAGFKNMPKAGSVKLNLYNKLVKNGDKIKVYQKVNGAWVEIEVSVRAEHLDVTLVGNGPIAIFRIQ